MDNTKGAINHTGLTNEEVSKLVDDGKINKTTYTVNKTYFQIVMSNVFSFFNIVYYIIAGLLIYGRYYSSLIFLGIIIPNMLIGLYQDIKARKLMDKLHLITAAKAKVIRDGKQETILSENLVLGDLVKVDSGDQICADSIIVEGEIGLNEALLTGESVTIYKSEGEHIYSGSYIVSGSALIKCEKIGKESYIETLQVSAKTFKRGKSEIKASLNAMFKVLALLSVCFIAFMVAVYASQGRLGAIDNFKIAIKSFSAATISFVPAGLFLLTSLALVVSVITLAKKNAQVQDFNAVEMLARSDVLCVDKTGTITDGTMEVVKIEPFHLMTEKQILSIAAAIVSATGDKNATAQAIEREPHDNNHLDVIEALPFNSENKYSAISCSDKTYVMGAFEFIELKEKEFIKNKCEDYSKKGYRVLVLAESNQHIEDKKIVGECNAIGLIVIKDHIKEDAKEIFQWFQKNDVTIKVISGDNEITTSEIATSAGIANADKHINLTGMSLEEVKAIANDYSIFGRVSPEQKAAIVEALQDQGHRVAMTGDGINDILALKKANCSIAMQSGSEAARNASHIVLTNSNFSSLPEVVGEGRRVINNLQRTSSLFLVKNITAFVLTMLFLIASLATGDKTISYPFLIQHMYLWEFAGIGVSAFFVALEKNATPIKGRFLSSIFVEAVPGAIAMIVAILLNYLLFVLQKNEVFYSGVSSFDIATTMAVISFTLLSLVVLFRVCYPLSKYRLIVIVCASIVVILALVGFALLSYFFGGGDNTLLKIRFELLGFDNYFAVLIITIGVATIYLSSLFARDAWKRSGAHD